MENATILKHIIEERRSIFPKDYSDKEIPQHIIDEILSNAVLAPNHKRTKPWRFKVFKAEEKQNLGQELQIFTKKSHQTFSFCKKNMMILVLKFRKPTLSFQLWSNSAD